MHHNIIFFFPISVAVSTIILVLMPGSDSFTTMSPIDRKKCLEFRSKTSAYTRGNFHALPPEFTVEDENDESSASSISPNSLQPDFSFEEDSIDSEDWNRPDKTKARAEDPYAEEEASFTRSVSTRHFRKSPPRRITKMATTNWMEKNAQYAPEDDGMSINESLSDSAISKRRDGMKEARSRMDSRTFRQDFRGTRVFVQGIPDNTSWQDLKDHFKKAGNVVFASVSVDPQTGAAKGHGIVQFETTQMAQNAIDIMRDYPLNGSTLFVREDVQENPNPGAQLSNVPKGPTPPSKWKCANEDNASYMSTEDQAAIRSLIKARDDARRRRNYDVSDRLRDELKYTHGVFIDDRLKMWWTAVDGNKVPQTIQDIKGEGRWKLDPWRMIPTTPENDACVNSDLVEGLLKQRDIARREKDFGTADALLEEARNSPDGDLTLRIHDESRTWRVWTDAPPPRMDDYSSSSSSSDLRSSDPRERAVAMECISIVEEFAPQKIHEIQLVLEKFPGREFQVLKRLKSQYLSSEEESNEM